MDLDDLHVWGGYQQDARACTPPIVQVWLDSRQPSSTEVAMRRIAIRMRASSSRRVTRVVL